MSNKIHELKTWPEYFQAIKDGRKQFEYRKDDRGFEVGHILLLREYDPQTENYTGDELKRRVSYILRASNIIDLRPGFCVMGLEELDAHWGPEDCKLVAYDTGDGWYLGVRDSKGNEVAMLAWPDSWPESMSASRLREIGFEVV